MVGVVIANPLVYTDQRDLPAATGYRGVRSLAQETGKALIDQQGGPRINAVANPSPTHSVMFHGTFYSDYFNRVYIIPAVLSLIDPQIGQPNKYQFWNTNFFDLNVTQVVGTNSTGLTLDLEIPFLVGGIKLRASNIIVEPDAPNEEIANYAFSFENGDKSYWTVNILKTNLLALSPEVPILEKLAWKTIVDMATDGTEQRTTLTQFTRVSHDVTFLANEDADIKTLQEQMATQVNNTFSYPLWAEQTRLLDDIGEGGINLVIDLSKFDVQAGDQLYFLGADETFSETVRVDQVGQDGFTVTLQSGVLNPWTQDDRLFRMTTVRMQEKPKFDVAPFGWAEGKVTLRFTEFRTLFSGPTVAFQEIGKDDKLPDRVLTALVYTLDSVPILNGRPIITDETVSTEYDWKIEVQDYDIGTFSYLTDLKASKPTYDRKYYNRYLYHKFYWNWLLEYMHGQRRPVWLPTFMNEIGPDIDVLSGSTILTTSEKYFNHYPLESGWRGVWIAYKDGYLARKITDVSTDSAGHTVISLDKAVPDDFPAQGPWDVGFLILARQATDEVQREWHAAYNFLSTSFIATSSTPEIT